ncbi:MAG: hypothetical protein HQL53_08155 [Magnetococcales bacterium]|nr:hypothetical protein [Magnetococcales bacterium]
MFAAVSQYNASSVQRTNPAIVKALESLKSDTVQRDRNLSQGQRPQPKQVSRYGEAASFVFSAKGGEDKPQVQVKAPEPVTEAINAKVQDIFQRYPNGGVKPTESMPHSSAERGQSPRVSVDFFA